MGAMKVEFTPEQSKRIEDLKQEIKCRFDFVCCDSGSDDVCVHQIISGGKVIFCMDERADMCGFSFKFGNQNCCKCPVLRCLTQWFHNSKSIQVFTERGRC